eukprot:5639146-Prymnesium_polylepis.1
MDEQLGEDEKVGGLATAVEVWLTAIRYMSDLHAPCKDHFDMAERKAHAEKCRASGQAWALAINEHTSNRALWQYVHDAFAHVHDDIMEHGFGDRNDDSILEKGNRRKKRLGDRCTMRGGKNNSRWTCDRRVAEKVDGVKTGRFIVKKVNRRANEGVAAYVQRLDLAAQICESTRMAETAKLSAKAEEAKAEAKVLREVNRDATHTAVVDFKAKLSA